MGDCALGYFFIYLKISAKKLFHVFPRAFVRAFVILRAFHAAVGVPIGEAVDGTALFDQLPVHTGVTHFALKSSDVFFRHERIIRAVQGEDFAFDVLALLGLG